MNFAVFLEMRARSAPDETALVDKRHRFTWSGLDRAASRFASLLVARGVKPGDRVATFMTNRAEMVIAFLGALKAGVVFLPVNARLQEADLARVLDHARPAMVLVTEDRAGLVAAPHADNTVVVDGAASLLALLDTMPDDFPMLGRQSHDIANIVYSSGTTGMPKAVIHTHGVRVAIAGGMADHFKLSIHDAALVVSPLFHIAGLNVLCNALFAGCKIVLLEKWDLADFLSILTAERITYMQMVSTILVDIAAAPASAFAGLDSAVRFTWGGGHNVDTETITLYEKRIGGVFLQGWGRTEGGFTYNLLDRDKRRFDTHGKVNTNASEVAVYDHAAGRLAAPGEIGEIVVRGDGVSPGYWDGDYVRVRPPLEGGWQPTGDLGRFDADGQMHFLGRDDHMIKTGGENVYPAEVEAVLLDMPEISDAVVLGIPDPRLGQRIAAVLVPTRPGVAAADVEAVCRRALAGFKIPRAMAFVDKLPRLGSEKVDLAACRELLRNAD
ncbi:class I adenylate-forming enzyme family protein [Chelativorans sp. Marseille-P2723]|uniref:class I adenylate-forming enzyme family protein n=1 Tax=Chelativorans sp. Marseille-P2723 TaxID=2709133 RepID=UPI00156EB3D5|nr:class I adenylate-forming enzyme family protein [Chelativorans sp. Marseille-P2723]